MRLLLIILLSALYLQGTAKTSLLPPGTDTAKKDIKKEVHFPDPANVSKLFYFQRDPNTNTLIYELNIDKAGELNRETPLHVYWIKYADKGQKEELNYIQRKFAYGLNIKEVKPEEWDIHFAAYKKLPLKLLKGVDGKYHIFTIIGKKQAILNRIFVKIEGGSFWLPNIIYAELKGTDAATGKEVMERFKP